MPCRCGLFVSYPLPRQNVESCVSCILTIHMRACVRARLSALSPKRHSILSKSLAPRMFSSPSDRIDLEYFNFSSFFIIPILILYSFVTLTTIFDARRQRFYPLHRSEKVSRQRGGNKVRSILLSDSELSLAKILNYYRRRGIQDGRTTRRNGGSEKTCTAENSKARVTLIARIKGTSLVGKAAILNWRLWRHFIFWRGKEGREGRILSIL